MCCLVRSITRPHTYAHLISKLHVKDLTEKECPSTYTQSLEFLLTPDCKTLPYIYAGCLPTYNMEPSIHLSLHPLPHSSHPLCPSIPPFTPARPTARSHTSITQHTHKCTKSEKASVIGREDKKGGGESRFHATLSTD